MGYTPVFSSLFQGSLTGKFPDLYVWLVMLGLADRNGDVDCTPDYIAMVSGISVALVERAVANLCDADPKSRTQTLDGRRLVPIPNRGFGWTIVNFQKYREKARLAAKNTEAVASGREAERKRYIRQQQQQRPPMSAEIRRSPPESDPSDSDSDLRESSSLTSSGGNLPRQEYPKRTGIAERPEDREPQEIRELIAQANPQCDPEATYHDWLSFLDREKFWPDNPRAHALAFAKGRRFREAEWKRRKELDSGLDREAAKVLALPDKRVSS